MLKAVLMNRIEQLKLEVCRANKELVDHGLVLFTWGNLSAYDRELGVVAIKPSGVEYSVMSANDIVVLDIDGNVLEGDLRPSSDTPTHLELYKEFHHINSIVHTHSSSATIYAQAQKGIPCYGTTHADSFYGEIPLVEPLSSFEISTDYEANTGKSIVKYFEKMNISPKLMSACLCPGHGPFVWGETIEKAVYNAAVLEQVATMAMESEKLNPSIRQIDKDLMDKHYFRKHGPGSYYGQKPFEENTVADNYSQN